MATHLRSRKATQLAIIAMRPWYGRKYTAHGIHLLPLVREVNKTLVQRLSWAAAQLCTVSTWSYSASALLLVLPAQGQQNEELLSTPLCKAASVSSQGVYDVAGECRGVHL